MNTKRRKEGGSGIERFGLLYIILCIELYTIILCIKQITNENLGLPWFCQYRRCMFDPLEKEMATCSSILVWETPQTEEPAWPQSMGSHESDTTQQLNKSSENLVFQLREPYSVLYGDLNGEAIQKRGDICIAESICCTAETNKTL